MQVDPNPARERTGNEPEAPSATTRRAFIQGTCATTLGSSLAANRASAMTGPGRGDDWLRIGLIGCGGRGSGAVANAFAADPRVKLVSMADMFPDRLQTSFEHLKKAGGDRFAVNADHCFTGFDAYRQMLATDVDVVLLATPPGFRPAHLKAAVDAGKHVFMEKPVAVDAPGVRSVLASCEEAQRKGLSVVSGLMLRHSTVLREMMKRIHGGEIGRIVALQCNYNIGDLWHFPRQPGWSDMEWQLRNWYYFTWLSGDHIVEQHVHGLDLMAWAMHDEYPIKCFGLGGRQARTGAEFGHIFDHHAVCYEFAGGVRCFSFCRQQAGTDNDTSQLVFGEKGTADLSKRMTQGDKPWRYSRASGGAADLPYEQEHRALFTSIRAGQAINNGASAAKSTLMAIMGRMATYTGRTVTWEQAWNSQEDLTPPKLEFGTLPVPPVAIPGVTKLV